MCAPTSNGRGQVSGAAAEVEDALAGLRREQIDQVSPELPNVGVIALVSADVPARADAHAFLPRALGFFPVSGAAAATAASGAGVAPSPVALDRTSLNNSAFFKSFLEGGACSCL